MSSENKNCPFCKIYREEQWKFIFEPTDNFFAITPIFPVHPYHILLIPIRHTESIFEFADNIEGRDLTRALRRAKEYLDKICRPQGYNIGVNCGAVAGQTVFHTHIHVVPRTAGDVPEVHGGIMRNLMQQMGKLKRP